MKKLFILSMIAFAMMMVACKDSCCKTEPSSNASVSQTFNLDTTRLKSGTLFYECEMHPEILSEKAGNCPKCGMELSERSKKN